MCLAKYVDHSKVNESMALWFLMEDQHGTEVLLEMLYSIHQQCWEIGLS